ncbi:MAG: type II 3-dehydroquinate dehydratase [Puniceicoccales bacterium]|jgi:3-dehydroquinate dehydratase-2|nr:type II 3-dehydroquinate dehydratase [Puniceicoccales bacterium]
MKKIGILNGPNLDRLGKREPKIYGGRTLHELEAALRIDARALGVTLEVFQSNYEGALIERIGLWADSGFSGLIINPGGFSHSSIALRDSIAGSGLSAVEVHISNIHKRESFRHTSITAGACTGMICGLGLDGYHAALYFLAGH